MTQNIPEDVINLLRDKLAEIVPFEHRLWSVEDIGLYLRREPTTVRERYTCLPSFPKAIRLPNKAGKKSYPLYKASEVVEWAEKFTEKN